MSYHHLTTFERGRIQELLSLGYSHRAIAQKLNRHRSCIDREIRRNAVCTDFCTNYVGETAQTAITSLYNTLPKGAFKTGTTDPEKNSHALQPFMPNWA